MSRQGVAPESIDALLVRFGRGSLLKLDGVMTHLFAADEADGAITQEQLERLTESLERMRAAGLQAEWLNVGNSAAVLCEQAAAIGAIATQFGMKALLRPGLALYGLAPQFDPGFGTSEPAALAEAHQRLEPVLR